MADATLKSADILQSAVREVGVSVLTAHRTLYKGDVRAARDILRHAAHNILNLVNASEDAELEARADG